MCGLDKSILPLHGFFGCDTTSQLFNISKDKVFKSIQLQTVCQEVSAIFYADNSDKQTISAAGGNILIASYQQKGVKSVNKLRHKIFMYKIAGKASVKPE